MDWEVGASGYAAVWATENTRDVALGRDAAPGDLRHHRPAHDRALLRRLGFRRGRRAIAHPGASSATRKGVPMGGDLRDAPAGKSPTFLVAALKDPIGANLDRIQIIKGWLDAKGEAAREDLRRRLVAATASRTRTASCRPSATPWTSRTPPGPTPSARRS